MKHSIPDDLYIYDSLLIYLLIQVNIYTMHTITSKQYHHGDRLTCNRTYNTRNVITHQVIIL